MGIGRRTVNRAAAFAKGVDTLREVNPAAADTVLTGKANVTKSAVEEMVWMERKEAEAVADIILTDKVKLMPPKQKHIGNTHEASEMIL